MQRTARICRELHEKTAGESLAEFESRPPYCKYNRREVTRLLKISGDIMSRDNVIAVVADGLIAESDPALLPLFLKRTGDIECWLKGRAIDAHRTNSRLLKKALRLTSADDAQVVLKVNAATVTDTYWFRAEGSALRYEDVRFKANYFDKLALRGDPDSFNQPYSPTPELTNIGSFEKCWRLMDGKWWMIKQGNDLERFSELLICKLGLAFGFPMADYQPENGTIKSQDFTDGAFENFEAADGIVGDDEDYALNFQAFWELSPELAEQYLQIIYMDALCFNMDRHTKNYGVLRNVETGAILRMAPNFDNNIALFARGIPAKTDRANDKLVSLLCDLLEQDNRAMRIVSRFPVPDRAMIEECISQISIPMDKETVCEFIINGSKQIRERIREL